MKRLAAVALLVGALLLTACSSISSGTITNKVAEPGMYTTTQSCAGYNKDGACSVWVPITSYDDPDWRFDIREGDDSGWVYVSQDTFDRYEVGDYFALDE